MIILGVQEDTVIPAPINSQRFLNSQRWRVKVNGFYFCFFFFLPRPYMHTYAELYYLLYDLFLVGNHQQILTEILGLENSLVVVSYCSINIVIIVNPQDQRLYFFSVLTIPLLISPLPCLRQSSYALLKSFFLNIKTVLLEFFHL